MGLSYVYERPERIVTASCPNEIAPAFEAIEAGLDEGLFAAGWVAYEAGYALEPKLETIAAARSNDQLLWFGLFANRKVLTRGGIDAFFAGLDDGTPFEVQIEEPSLDRGAYFDSISRIKSYLAAGDVYQVNFTFPINLKIDGGLIAAHRALRASQPVEFGALIAAPDHCIASYSPEMFIAKHGSMLTAKPMKGTAPRGRWLAEDRRIAEELAEDEKSRAENLMIVDLLRNDLSRIAQPGSVDVSRLYEVETYRTVQQMTSTIEAMALPGQKLFDFFSSLFPCGSVTGAPKIRAMEIIDELESAPRGVYTGAIGHITPQRDFSFSVPIRTIVMDRDGRGVLGTGSGIVADSTPQAEFDESLLKAAFLDDPQPSPELIETILWRPTEGYWLLDMHLDRLVESATYFRYPCTLEEVGDALIDFASELESDSDVESAWRVRLLLAATGAMSITASPIGVGPAPSGLETIVLHDVPVDSQDPHLFHKTTRRQFYDQVFASEAESRNHIDVVFFNERGELTEGSRTNIFVEIGKEIYTPPIACGLLPGTLRRSLLEDSQSRVVERVLSRNDLELADRIFVGNSIHGLRPVKIAEQLV